ncbi:mandelate racemase/muconate lactonizing enzyme family protein [Sedimentitalea sp.]|uniref:mandelate racemase/muconate lactonizing enzyme family protein n=1 Tax=Sedimentitalea sp. TaxID=2048915 RepID=UPI00329A164E
MSMNNSSAPVRIMNLDVQVFRVPITTPVVTSFGIMKDRPAVFLRVESSDGDFGWGEVFCNWPAAGAEHRGRLLVEDVAEFFLGQTFASPEDAFRFLGPKMAIRALQCGEPGPFGQVISGIDIAMHDLFARRAGQPLHDWLGGRSPKSVPAYASGINIAEWEQSIQNARKVGFHNFKLKVGFDLKRDTETLRAIHAGLEPHEKICVDANQAWAPEEAVEFSRKLADIPLLWIEEPIRADSDLSTWRALAKAMHHPVAAGENIVGINNFITALDEGGLAVVQPDVAKWGGVTEALIIAANALQRNKFFCPHFLGAGIGLSASAHFLAAAGGPGFLEVDLNWNPLRDLYTPLCEQISEGKWRIASTPGLGIEELPAWIEEYRTFAASRFL